VPSAIHQFTNSGCFTSQFWWGDVRQHWQRNLWKIILQLQSINQLFARKGKRGLTIWPGNSVQLQFKKKSKTKDVCFKDTGMIRGLLAHTFDYNLVGCFGHQEDHVFCIIPTLKYHDLLTDVNNS
jgi:hypothetical protein